ncbi:DUF5710 domain-containing protein [Denitromonas ohlonensis]|uniref:DUF5710 domain-containing protein n=2 Tax=Denitromonas TaxID=139331 RepID=A0A557SPM6_9RHOO|nr:DUF5710 domain-containing protein [Denitromonas ohlonensis]TVO65770.1 hypothetical protein FHP90_09775 [Denitromonas ohlonensis]TVO79363.1 hypothetical protein FHP89_00960 [Denitromonas ohlonensis]
MRLNLRVPFAEKDEAKKLGARWDAARKIWYVEGKDDVTSFSRWSPTPHDASTSAAPAPKRAPSKAQSTSSGVQIGSRYVESPRICDCAPWDVCDICRATALSS